MAKRIRSCTNNTGFETINCGSYVNRLVKHENPILGNKPGYLTKCPRDRINSNIKSNGTLAPYGAPNLRSRCGFNRQQNLVAKNQKVPTDFTHKEVVNDNAALVEVTVRAHTGRRPQTEENTKNNRKPWAKLLKPSNSNDNLGSFNNFDPLRTVHFLAKEIQSKLKINNPSDNNVIEMISDMQHALNRVPPEVASTIRLQQQLEKPTLKRSNSDIQTFTNRFLLDDDAGLPEKLIPSKQSMETRACQTKNANTNVPNTKGSPLQKKLEASTTKLEQSCKHMEKVCINLKNEKEQVEHLLRTERDTVSFLRNQIADLEMEKMESTNAAYQKLLREKNELQSRVKDLQTQLDMYQGPSFQELKSLLQKLQLEKAGSEQENLSLRHQLTLCNMEKEKYIAILSVRDRQINEIQTEMGQLQEVVNEQLLELQKSPILSAPSSQSTIVGGFDSLTWNKIQANTEKYDKNKGDHPLSPSHSAPVHNLFTNNALLHTFKELPSGDSSASNFESMSTKVKRNDQESSIEFSMPPPLKVPSGYDLEKLISSRSPSPDDNIHVNIRDMFTELKRQAFTLNVPLPNPPSHHQPETQQSNNSDTSINK